jgi:hypothetical protein
MQRKTVALLSLAVLSSFLLAGTGTRADADGGIGFKVDLRFLPLSDFGNEPSIALSQQGVRYVSWQSPGEFAVSRDGAKWMNTGIPDSDALGDVTNAVDASGAVYDGQICGDAFSLHTCVYRSVDGTRNWPQKTEPADSHPGASDRPWIDVYPRRGPGSSNPNHTRVYLEYHTFSPDDLAYVTVSTDGGQTFSEPKNITNDPDALSSSSCNTIPSGVVVDQQSPHKGNVYAMWLSGNDVTSNAVTGCNYSQIGPFDKAWVSTSTDGGKTWTAHLAWHGQFDPASKTGDNADKIFGDIAVDASGQLHAILAVRHHDDPVGFVADCETNTDCKEAAHSTDLYMVTSPDLGAHWTEPIQINQKAGSFFFPWLAAGTAGRVDAIYYHSPSLRPNDPKSVWYIGFAQITGAAAKVAGGRAVYESTPHIHFGVLDPRSVHKGGICSFGIFCSVVPRSNRHLADSIAIALDPSGGANAVWTDDNQGNRQGHTSHIEFACQSSGPSAISGKPPLSGCFRAPAG